MTQLKNNFSLVICLVRNILTRRDQPHHMFNFGVLLAPHNVIQCTTFQVVTSVVGLSYLLVFSLHHLTTDLLKRKTRQKINLGTNNHDKVLGWKCS